MSEVETPIVDETQVEQPPEVIPEVVVAEVAEVQVEDLKHNYVPPAGL